MIDVTPNARRELKRMLSAKVDNSYAGLRLTNSGQGKLGLSIDIELAGDHVVEHEGSKVLFVDEGLATSIEGVTLDVEDTSDGPQLIICESDSARN